MSKKEKAGNDPEVSRREFVKAAVGATVGAVVGAAAGAAGMSAMLPPTVVEKEVAKTVEVEKPVIVEKEVTKFVCPYCGTEFNTVEELEEHIKEELFSSKHKIVYDSDKCKGCGICMVCCSTYHYGIASPELSRLVVNRNDYNGEKTMSICQQCNNPSCYFACPVGAIKIDDKIGIVYVDEDECTGCGICAEACPFTKQGLPVIRSRELETKNSVGSSKVYFKCDLCRGRPEGPVCVEICPFHALTYV